MDHRSLCLPCGNLAKKEHENMRQSTDKCHEAFPNQTISDLAHIIFFFIRKLNRTTLAQRQYASHGTFCVGK